MNDAELALLALPGAQGVCLVAGTGSIAVGRDRHQRRLRAGGWGHVMGDEGSGYDLGRRALQAVVRAADGRGPGTSLQDAVVGAWGLSVPEHLVGRVYPEGNKGLVADLAPLVFQAAAEGDVVAGQIVQEAAVELAAAVLAVARKLAFEGPLPLALTGGLLRGQPSFGERVVHLLREHRAVEPVVLVHDPALTAAQALAKERRGG